MKDIQKFNEVILENFKTDNVSTISENINNFLKSIENKNKYDIIIKKFDGFSKDKLGRSGGIVGKIYFEEILKEYNKSVKKSKKIKKKSYSFIGMKDGEIIKIYKYNIKKIITHNKKNCLKIFYPINELINNTIINNLENYMSKKDYNFFNKNYKNHIIKTIEIGITKNTSYMISETIGLKKKNTYFYTTLDELFEHNYIPNIIKLLENKELDVLKLLINYLSDIISNYINILIFLNKKIGFIHTDLKLANIFIRYKLNTNSKYNKLKKQGFIIDYIPLISDLDKSIIQINKKIITIPKIDNFIKNIFNNLILKHFISNKLFYMRMSCKRRENFCHNFKAYHFDILSLYFNLYGIIIFHMNKFIEKKDIQKILEPLNKLFKSKLSLNDKQFELLFNIIFENKKEKYRMIHYDKMINTFCKKLKKTKKVFLK